VCLCSQVEGGGYAGVRDVTMLPPTRDDTMQSFWLAETLKYAWLVFAPDDAFSLDTHVLNTEAHPLRVLTRPLPRAVRARLPRWVPGVRREPERHGCLQGARPGRRALRHAP
jgi:hypothetical protein